MIVLGIESSCDESAACVMRMAANGPEILAQQISSQHEVHAPHGGIVPELASRRHIEVVAPLVRETLAAARCTGQDLDGIAVTHRPGLLGSLLVGLCFAKAYAWTLQKPFVGVSHLEGHLNSPFLEHANIAYPHIALLASGGHTALYHVTAFDDYRLIGATRDDAAGEAFDKVAQLLELGYPGGPVIDRLAKEGDPQAIDFPRGTVKGHPLDFSFSGLKTAVRRYLEDKPAVAIPNICASFQEAVVDALVEKTMAAAQQFETETVLLTGGVACNSRLRTKLHQAAEGAGKKCIVSSPQYCTDNAAMIAYVGAKHLERGDRSPWDLNAYPTERLK